MILMTTNDFIQVVNGVGFPIVVCIFLVWYIWKDKKRRSEERKEYEKRQNELYVKLSQSVDNNTLALNNLIAKLEGKYNGSFRPCKLLYLDIY